jgi:hypothetical protein
MLGPSNLFAKNACDQNTDNGRVACLVVFVDQTECSFLRFLKPGFRHCFVALQNRDRWIICDSLKNYIELFSIDTPSSFNLGKFYCKSGHRVIQGFLDDTLKSDIVIPEIFTCVAVAKRIIGVRSSWTVTPWQLYRLLRSRKDRWQLVE